MHLAFVQPELARLDSIKSDALTLCLLKEDWPLRGTPGLVDWRVSGHLSRLRESGWITCDVGEIILMPLARRLPFEKLIVVGMGSLESGLESEKVATAFHQLFDALALLRVHATVIHLPGRPFNIDPERVMDILLDVANDHPDHAEITVVESLDAQEVMQLVYNRRNVAQRD
jgi:hypothetical protein